MSYRRRIEIVASVVVSLVSLAGHGQQPFFSDGFEAGELCSWSLIQPLPVEVCDLLDNDCDGVVDDGNPPDGIACDTGLLGVCADGITDCSGPELVCEQQLPSSPEVCDRLDNDCDGFADDGNPGGGQPCSTGQQGVCGPGTTNCVSGSLICQPNTSPSPELCNAVDDDCDGSTDEGNPGGGADCDTGLLGVCAAGTMTCSQGALSCEQDFLPLPEVCDGKDNDCDGQVDEGACLPGGG